MFVYNHACLDSVISLAHYTSKILFFALFSLQAVLAFDTPLSEEAIREAYFLGQHHDDSVRRALEKYTLWYARPSYGPHIVSVTYLTPFAQAVLLSDRQAANYSAQQAQLDHRSHPETVQIQVSIRFTDTYGALLAPDRKSARTAQGLRLRPSDFWRDFSVSVFDGEKLLEPSTSDGHPDYTCNEAGCYLIGATIVLDFPAEAFVKQDAAVQIDPPEGDQFVSEFDLSTVR